MRRGGHQRHSGAAIAGAEKIIAVDLLPKKLEFAKQFGATHTVNSKETNPWRPSGR